MLGLIVGSVIFFVLYLILKALGRKNNELKQMQTGFSEQEFKNLKDLKKQLDVYVSSLNQKADAGINQEETLDHILQKNTNNRNQIIDSLIDKMADSYEEEEEEDEDENEDDNSVTYNYSLISKKLLEGVMSISKTAVAGLKSHQDEEMVLCECIMIISSIAIRQVSIKIDNDEKTALLASDYKQLVTNYFKLKYNHSELFDDNYTVNNFVDNRFSIYYEEIIDYSVDKEFAFPKASYSIFISPMDENVDNHFGVENLRINLHIPIWMKALDKPIDILLLLR